MAADPRAALNQSGVTAAWTGWSGQLRGSAQPLAYRSVTLTAPAMRSLPQISGDHASRRLDRPAVASTADGHAQTPRTQVLVPAAVRLVRANYTRPCVW